MLKFCDQASVGTVSIVFVEMVMFKVFVNL